MVFAADGAGPMSVQAQFLLFDRVECQLDDAVIPLGRPRAGRCLFGLLLLGAGLPVPATWECQHAN